MLSWWVLQQYIGVQSAQDANYKFASELIFGNFFKNIIAVVLQQSGYEVYPYGFENAFPSLIRQLNNRNPSEAAKRIRKTPDLLVVDRTSGEIFITEVKARTKKHTSNRVSISDVKDYKKYWGEAILILMVPEPPHFFAQYISVLGKDNKYTYNLHTDFLPFNQIFSLVDDLPEEYMDRIRKTVSTIFNCRISGDL